MRLQLVAGALALVGTASALSDSSPWIVVSTSPFNGDANSDRIQTSAAALKTTKGFLSTCPTDRYAIVRQPGLHSSDLVDAESMRNLWSVVQGPQIKGKFIVPEVVDASEDFELSEFIKKACSHQSGVEIESLSLSTLLEGDARAAALSSNDVTFAEKVESLISSSSFTVIFLGTSNEPTYEPEFEEPVHLDLKRNVHAQPERRDDNGTDWNNLPLFEKYQYFTPGIFMGLLATIILGSILTVGLKAVASLEVSYGAFEKDMGPAAQKKQQ